MVFNPFDNVLILTVDYQCASLQYKDNDEVSPWLFRTSTADQSYKEKCIFTV
jgi:hypothetical protein